MTYPAQPNYGAPQQYQQPQQPMQYPQGPAPQPQYAPAPQQVDLQPMMYGQQQTYAAPPAQFQQPMPAQPQQQGGTGGFFTQQDPHTQTQQQYAPAAPPQFQQPPPMPAQPVDTSSFFGGAATISWDATKGYRIGTFRGGQILDKKIVPQTKLGTNEILKWGDGSVREQMVLTLQTAERTDPQDNGQRQMFLKGDAPRAAREAFQAAGAKDLELGGWYYQAWVDEKAAKQPGYNPQKVFRGVYAPPGSPDPMAGQAVFTPQPAAPAMPQQQPGPLGQMPQQAVANFAQAAQFDPAVQAATGMTQGQLAQAGQVPQFQQAAYAPPQQAMANFQQPSAFTQAASPEVTQMQPQGQQPTMGFQQGQPVPYGALPGDLSAQQNGQQPVPQSNGQHPEQAQQPAQHATPQAAPGGYNPFGPTG